MELPEDVLAIVRAYSKPLMKFSEKYNWCMQEMENNHEPFYLKMIVKKRLCDKDADQVIDALIGYVDALLTTKRTKKLMEFAPLGNDTPSWRERNVIIGQVAWFAGIQYKKTIVLLDLLYMDDNDAKWYESEKNYANYIRLCY